MFKLYCQNPHNKSRNLGKTKCLLFWRNKKSTTSPMWGSRHNSLPRGGLFTDSTTKNSSNHKKIVLLPKLSGGLDEENNKNLKRLPSPLCLEAVGGGCPDVWSGSWWGSGWCDKSKLKFPELVSEGATTTRSRHSLFAPHPSFLNISATPHLYFNLSLSLSTGCLTYEFYWIGHLQIEKKSLFPRQLD